jgi:hypothetical protein
MPHVVNLFLCNLSILRPCLGQARPGQRLSGSRNKPSSTASRRWRNGSPPGRDGVLRPHFHPPAVRPPDDRSAPATSGLPTRTGEMRQSAPAALGPRVRPRVRRATAPAR